MQAQLAIDPNYPLPDNFTKVKEVRTVQVYDIPERTAKMIGEARTVSLSVIDDLCNELFGVHILESRVIREEKFRVKLMFTRQQQKADVDVVEIMRRFDDEKSQASGKATKLKPMKASLPST